eukprot:TRINITY_DN3054_c1_g1_i9.p2 TRINITY_DN3054_c1_g1~~TRINITY_DN3054_c1_g1_i9.p2  ORF type:complete len:222 (-),score=23.64 TRINITY_DN3054_c1_g1_i9:187-852(-)
MTKIVVILMLTYLCQACDIALEVQPGTIKFEGSVSEPISADILLNETDVRVEGVLYLLYDGPCSNNKLQKLLSESDIQLSTGNETLKLLPDPVSAIVEPKGFLGFLAGLLTEIKVELTNVQFSMQSDSFALSPKSEFSSNITVEFKSGEGKGSASLIPGGLADVDLTGTKYTTSVQGIISLDEDDNLVLQFPSLNLSLDINVQGATASFDIAGDFTALESE